MQELDRVLKVRCGNFASPISSNHTAEWIAAMNGRIVGEAGEVLKSNKRHCKKLTKSPKYAQKRLLSHPSG